MCVFKCNIRIYFIYNKKLEKLVNNLAAGLRQKSQEKTIEIETKN